MTRLVHWHEGMFMRVQSLQMMQQGLMERIEGVRSVAGHYPYGVIDARLSKDKLLKGKVKFENLHVIMRSGLEVMVPQAGRLEELAVCEELVASTRGEILIMLAVPDYSPDFTNVLEFSEPSSSKGKSRYVQIKEQRSDENTGDNKQPITTRILNARLIFEHDPNKAGLECLPLLRIRRSATSATTGTEFAVEPAATFVPPCLFVPALSDATADGGGFASSLQVISLPGNLSEIIRLAVQRVEVTRSSLSRRLQGEGLNMASMQGVQFRQWIRLLALSRHAPRLLAIQQAPNTTPFEIYLELNEILSELEAIKPAADVRMNQAIKFDHDNPYPVFEKLGQRIDKAMQDVDGVASVKASFNPDPKNPGNLIAPLSADFFKDNVSVYFLTIQTSNLSIGELQTTVENRMRFELTVPRDLGRGDGGLQLRYEITPPVGMPDAPDLHYFRVEQSSNSFHQVLWGKVKAEKELAVSSRNPHINLSSATFTLYATLRPNVN